MNRPPDSLPAPPDSPGLWGLFLAHTPASVAVLDRDLRYLAVSDRWYKDLELEGVEVVGRLHYDVFPDLDEERRERHRRCLAGEIIRHDSDEYILPSGARLSVKWEYVPWRDRQGEVGGILIFSEVVTREKLLEERVEAEANRLKRAELLGGSGAWEWDIAENRVTWSEGVAALLGLAGQEADDNDWMRLVHPEDKESLARSVTDALRGEASYDLEARVVRDDGRLLHLRILGEVTRDAAGHPLSVLGAMQDVSQSRQQERELRTLHRRYRLASEVSGTAAWEILPLERRILADENLARLIGRGNETISDNLDDWIAALPPADQRKVEEVLAGIVAGERSTYDLTMRTRLPDGRSIWLSAYGRVLGRQTGETLRIVGTTRDVTERKQAELALANSERNLLVAQQIAQLGSWEWDVGSETLNCSPEMLRLYGFPADHGPLPLGDLMSRVHPDDAARVAADVERLRSGQDEIIETEMRLVRPEGGTIWITGLARAFLNEKGGVIRMNGAVQDNTARRAADREIAIRDSALQNSAGAIAMVGADGYFSYGNRAFMDLMGATGPEEIRRLHALDPVRDPELAQAAFGSLLGPPGHWEGELPIVRLDGSHRDVLVAAAAHRGAPDEEPLIIASYMDVTERNEALREVARSERQLRQAQSMARLGETHYDAASRLYTMPAATRAILGVGDEFACFDAKAGQALIHPDDRAALNVGAERLIRGVDERAETTYRFMSQTRGMLHVQTVNYVERDATGRVIGMNGIIQDVTHIKQAEQEAHEARQRAERYLDIAGVIIIALDPDGTIRLVNRQCRELLGYAEDELMGRNWFQLAVPPDVRSDLKLGLDRLVDTGDDRYQRREGYVVTRKGERRLIDWITSSVRDSQTGEISILSSGRDLTELRRAEQSLRDSEARNRAVMEAASIGIVTMDSAGAIVSLNPEAERIVGAPVRDMAGNRLSEVLLSEDRAVYAAMFLPVGDAGDPKAGLGVPREFTLLRHGSETVPVEISVTAMQIGGQRAYVAAIQDITDRKRAEAQLQQVQKLETIGQLTGGVAHDFNNLLMAMQVNIEMLKEMVEDDPDGNEFADAALSSVARGAELTSRLLAFSRRQPLRPKVIDINKLVDDTVRILQRTLGEQIAIETMLQRDVWPVEVDRSQLENVLMNLAVNARDAMPLGGRLTIETLNAQLDDHYAAEHGEVEAGDYLMLAVTDTGTGMTPQVIARAFEPFFTTKDVGRGSGLGLSMTYGFVKQSGGHIKIYSEPGEGTTIKIYFPRDKAGVAEDEPVRETRTVKTGTETILLVEDDPAVRQTVTVLLESLGYRVVVASDGPEAIQLVSDGVRPDLLLADIVLPKGMTGRQVSEAIGEKLPGCKTLFMSGYTENAIIHHGRLDEGVVLLSKPFPRNELADKLREVLDS
ncbi:PAS domain S-box protein [Iodidimonas sp. SYSU 1G8]|uniref:PAS domain S-box protein n=1 Tax=Iodidimonas sp. SYSU 1G8 TaxID=3133967 RepID=UPI0031FF0F31